jgi:hypothetical protein
VISPNGLLSSLWVCQHKDESNPFLFARQKSTHHVTFEQSPFLYWFFSRKNPGMALAFIPMQNATQKGE